MLLLMAICAIMRGMTKKPEPPKRDPHLMQVKLTPEMVDQLDDLRRNQSDIPNRSEMIRRLIRDAHDSGT